MKKFTFSLQKLKDYREQILERQKNALNKLRAEYNQIEESIAQLERVLAEKNAELTGIYASGSTPMEISIHKRYIVTLQQEIKEKHRLLALKDEEIKKQLDVVVEANKEVSTLEKLEEKQLEEHKKTEAKEQELFVEEFVSNSGFSNSY